MNETTLKTMLAVAAGVIVALIVNQKVGVSTWIKV